MPWTQENNEEVTSMTPEKLVEMAKEAMTHAYAPYSGYKVGAALLCSDGTVYQGCNIENASYSPTNCAERTAFFKAVSEGETEFFAIAVAGGNGDKVGGAFPPCGVCRQVMSEFCDKNFKIYLYNGVEIKTYTLGELMPDAFSLG